MATLSVTTDRTTIYKYFVHQVNSSATGWLATIKCSIAGAGEGDEWDFKATIGSLHIIHFQGNTSSSSLTKTSIAAPSGQCEATFYVVGGMGLSSSSTDSKSRVTITATYSTGTTLTKTVQLMVVSYPQFYSKMYASGAGSMGRSYFTSDATGVTNFSNVDGTYYGFNIDSSKVDAAGKRDPYLSIQTPSSLPGLMSPASVSGKQGLALFNSTSPSNSVSFYNSYYKSTTGYSYSSAGSPLGVFYRTIPAYSSTIVTNAKDVGLDLSTTAQSLLEPFPLFCVYT